MRYSYVHLFLIISKPISEAVLTILFYAASRPDYFSYGHSGSVACVERSPFFSDIVLSVGGWNWAVWREGEKVSQSHTDLVPFSATCLIWDCPD